MTVSEMFCATCGADCAAEARFCARCGSSTKSEASGKSRTTAVVGIAGGALLILGSFLPWAKLTAPFIGTVTKSGVEGSDGWFSVVLGVVAAVFALAAFQRGGTLKLKIGLAIIGILGIGGFIVEFADLHTRFAAATSETDLITVSYGSGLWLVLVGAATVLAAALRLQASKREVSL